MVLETCIREELILNTDKTVTRIIEADEDIWVKGTDDEDRGDFLTLEDQRGVIQLDLTEALALSDQDPTPHLLVKAPRTRDIQKMQSERGNIDQKEIEFLGACCIGIKPKDLENMHGRDYARLSRLTRNFIL